MKKIKLDKDFTTFPKTLHGIYGIFIQCKKNPLFCF